MGILIPDAPHSSRWFSRREAVVIMSRKRHDHHTVEKRQLRWDQVWETVRDVKTYLYFFLGFFANVPNGATSNCKHSYRLIDKGLISGQLALSSSRVLGLTLSRPLSSRFHMGASSL